MTYEGGGRKKEGGRRKRSSGFSDASLLLARNRSRYQSLHDHKVRLTFLGSLNEAEGTVAGVETPEPIENPDDAAEGGEIEGEWVTGVLVPERDLEMGMWLR